MEVRVAAARLDVRALKPEHHSVLLEVEKGKESVSCAGGLRRERGRLGIVVEGSNGES